MEGLAEPIAIGPLTILPPMLDSGRAGWPDEPVHALRCDMDLMVDKKPEVREDDSPAAELGLAGEPVTNGGGEGGGMAVFLVDADALAVAGRMGCRETSLVSLR